MAWTRDARLVGPDGEPLSPEELSVMAHLEGVFDLPYSSLTAVVEFESYNIVMVEFSNGKEPVHLQRFPHHGATYLFGPNGSAVFEIGEYAFYTRPKDISRLSPRR